MDSIKNESNDDTKADQPEKAVLTADFIPLKSNLNEGDEKSASSTGNGEKNAVKRIKPEVVEDEDSNGKKPRTSPPEPLQSVDEPIEAEEHYLTVSNLPKEWTFVKIKNYLDSLCGVIDEMEMVKQEKSQYCAVRLTFQSAEKCTNAFEKLKCTKVQDKLLEVEFSVPDYSQPEVEMAEDAPSGFWRPDEDMYDTDPQGLYGLRPQFLKSLNITPPIDRWVHVSNFRCDKSELREVMELAGDVLMCCVVTVLQRYAKVMYSHPLEAVQAVSMLNGQMYYGIPLKVSMDRNPTDCLVLPKGLANVGLGLGIGGRPVRNIAHHYQRYARKQSSLINPIVFSKFYIPSEDGNMPIEFYPEESEEEINKRIDEFVKSKNDTKVLNQTSKVKNVDELDNLDTKSLDGSAKSIESVTKKPDSRKSSIGSVGSPSQDNKPKNGPSAPIRPAEPRGFVRPGMRPRTLMPTPPFRPFGGPMRPGPFGPRPPFMPGPGFGPQPMRQPIRQPMPPPMGPPMGQPMPQPLRPPGPMSQPVPQPMPQVMPQGMAQPGPPGFTGPRPQMPAMNFQGPSPRPNPGTGSPVTVRFANLPPSTTFPLLCEKLAQCGQVISVQLTTPGCAVATFAQKAFADRCFQTFNGMNVDGFVIEVKYA